ncbi:MAG: hypothetical protein R3E48_02570 [Burkholderiaceae bacterium]
MFAALAAALGSVISGCTDYPSSAQLHAPGQYSGKTDPLVKKAADAAHAEALAKRFALVQTDR